MVPAATPQQNNSSTASSPRTESLSSSAHQPSSKRNSFGLPSALSNKQQQLNDESSSTSLSDSTLSFHQHSDTSSRLGGQGTDSSFHSPLSTSALVNSVPGSTVKSSLEDAGDLEDIAAVSRCLAPDFSFLVMLRQAILNYILSGQID